MIKNIKDIEDKMLEYYTSRKLYNRTGGKEMYFLREFFVEEYKNGNIKAEIDNVYLIDILTSLHSVFSDITELFVETLNKIKNQEDLISLLKLSVRNANFYPQYKMLFADKIWDKLTYESRLKISKNCIISSIWTSRDKEDLLYFMYSKGFVNFTDLSSKWGINRINDVANLSIEFLSKVKVNYTDEIIKDFVNAHRKDIPRRIEFLFSIPVLKEKFLSDEKWKFVPMYGNSGKMIDHFPEDERQKFIEKLKEEMRQNQNL